MLENHKLRVESIKNRGNIWSKLSGHENPTFNQAELPMTKF